MNQPNPKTKVIPMPEHSLQVLAGQNVPYSQEAEEAVLGAVLVNPSIYASIAGFLKAEDFYFVRHAYIWRAMHNLYERQDGIDYLTIVQEIGAMGWLNEIGGPPFITHLVTNTPTSIHAEVYGRLVERAAIRRAMLGAADEIHTLALDTQKSVDEIVNEIEAQWITVTERLGSDQGILVGQAAEEYMTELGNQVHHPPVSTGLYDLDGILGGGLHRGELSLWAGRPGMGKTTLLLNIAMEAARRGKTVAFFTMEMRKHQIMQRFMAGESGINSTKLRNTWQVPLNEEEQYSLLTAKRRIQDWKLIVDDTTGNKLNPPLLRAKLRRIKAQYGLDLVVVDYLQKMSSGQKFKDRLQEVSYLSRAMKDLAMDKDLYVPMMVATQLNRECEKRQDKRPILSDLRETGELEQEADTVVFLYRDSVYNECTEFPNSADLIIAKQRNGPTGAVSAYFERSLPKFLNAAIQRVDLGEEDILF